MVTGTSQKYFLFPEAMEGTDGSGPRLLSEGLGFLFTITGSLCASCYDLKCSAMQRIQGDGEDYRRFSRVFSCWGQGHWSTTLLQSSQTVIPEGLAS